MTNKKYNTMRRINKFFKTLKENYFSYIVFAFLLVIAVLLVRYPVLSFIKEDIVCRIYGAQENAIIVSIDTIHGMGVEDDYDKINITGKYNDNQFVLNDIGESDFQDMQLKKGDMIQVLVWKNTVTTLYQGTGRWFLKIIGMILCLGIVFVILRLFIYGFYIRIKRKHGKKSI